MKNVYSVKAKMNKKFIYGYDDGKVSISIESPNLKKEELDKQVVVVQITIIEWF